MLGTSTILTYNCENIDNVDNMNTMNTENPLLQPFGTLHDTPPFSKIRTEHFKEAFDASLSIAREELKAISDDTSTPTFQNTIEAIENCGELLDKVSEIFFNLESANTDDLMQQIAQDYSPLLTEFGNDLFLDNKIFVRVKELYDKKDSLNLDNEQMQLLENTYSSFERNGANLNDKDKEQFREISKQLSVLTTKFSQNVLAETNAFSLNITDRNDLAGLPDYVVEAAAEQAAADGKTGWVFNLQYPSYVPFMQHSEKRELRQKMFEAYSKRGNRNNENNNTQVIRDIVNLRLKKARMLGCNEYSSFVLKRRMASDKDTVYSFLDNLLEASLPVARQEVAEVQEFARNNGADFELQRWDWSFYSEKLKQQKFDLSDEMTKPYFELQSVIKAVFELASTLYGITFKLNEQIEKYHDEVLTYEIFDENNQFMAVLYLDFHPRASKQGGAWMTNYAEQYVADGIDHRPQVSLVCNFTKPTQTTPSLLTHSELETFLHEFGHGLHSIFSKCKYSSLSGTNVYRDFVELPSQIMENWASEKEWLHSFARHYLTGEPIPDELVDKIIAARNFNSGYQSVRQLSFGYNDMAWHSITEEFDGDVCQFEQKAMAKTELMPTVPDTAMSTSFGHIFGGGYAAGYYGYKWAEVLDADAFAEFKKNGIFDKNTANRFRKCLLEKGGTQHPMSLFVDFKGRKPTVDALLERSGLKKK